jgi:hypothetical protein
VIESDPDSFEKAIGSLATTLTKLRELGYRSRPLRNDLQWNTFRRKGTVIAEKRSAPWTWTTRNGQVMQADAGDWEVRDVDGGDSWSVRDDIFSSTYEHIDGQRWRRCGVVRARPARGGETIETLEGPAEAADGDWVIRGDRDELWPVPPEEFARRYEGPVSSQSTR